jgi:hypothetical protein
MGSGLPPGSHSLLAQNTESAVEDFDGHRERDEWRIKREKQKE